MIVYDEQKHDDLFQKFISKHGNDFKVFTSPVDCKGSYVKVYAFSDDSAWTEIYSVVYEDVSVTVRGIDFEFSAKLFRTEFFSTDDSISRYVFSKY